MGLFNKVRLETGAFFVAARGWFISLKLGGGFPCCVLVCVVFSGMSELSFHGQIRKFPFVSSKDDTYV